MEKKEVEIKEGAYRATIVSVPERDGTGFVRARFIIEVPKEGAEHDGDNFVSLIEGGISSFGEGGLGIDHLPEVYFEDFGYPQRIRSLRDWRAVSSLLDRAIAEAADMLGEDFKTRWEETTST